MWINRERILRSKLQRDPVIFFGRVEHDNTLQFGNIGHLAQLPDKEIPVGTHVRHYDLDHKIMFAADDMEFHHFGKGADHFDEFAAKTGGMFFQYYIHEEYDQLTDLAGIDHGGIMVDDPGRLQPPETLMDRGRRKTRFFGQFPYGEPAVFLEQVQDPDIYSIELKG